jgi:DNA-directed RNA polymerase subunit RPC12/RpoP
MAELPYRRPSPTGLDGSTPGQCGRATIGEGLVMGLFGKKKDDQPEPPAPGPPGQPQAGASIESMMPGYDPAVTAAQMHRADNVLGALGKVGRLGGKDFQARIAGAQANMAAAEAQMAQYSQMGGGAAVGSKSWMDTILHPQTDFMRQCTCAECGGQKKLPSPTAYMYCDYCSALVDYDFRKVVGGTVTTTMPDMGYVQWINQINTDRTAAKAAGDHARLETLERQFYDSWITKSPEAVSHRCGDPTYRQAFLEFMVASSMAISFDPSMHAMDEELEQAVTHMVYGGGTTMGSMQIDPDSFWPILDVVMRQQQTSLALTAAAGVPDKDPDRTPEVVRKRMGISTMVQGWMPYLSADAGEEMLRRTGLQGEYKHIDPVSDGATRHCGKCGQEFTALAGAKVAVCDHCGHKLDVGAAEWPCNTCGGLVTMPAGEASTTCPFCKGLIDRVGR